MKHILYISSTLPTPGFGSSVIFYRHLSRLQGWGISIAIPETEIKVNSDFPSNWEVTKIPTPKWWLPVKTRLPWSFELYLCHAAKALRKKLKNRPSAILNQFGKNSCLAYSLSKKWNVPLNLVIHDRWEVWAKGHDAFFLGQGWDKKILNQASRIWVVSDEMGEHYRRQVIDPSKISTLYPIPEGIDSPLPEWKDEYGKAPIVGFSGSFHSHQIETFKMVAEALRKRNGKLIIVSKKIDEIKAALSGIQKIEYKKPFEKNTDVIEFFKKNVSASLVADSIDKKAIGEGLSFPSRFIEFSHCGLPIIVVSGSGTALSNVATRLHWKGYVGDGDIEPAIEKIVTRESWREMAKQSVEASRTIFSAENIQNQFLTELVYVPSETATETKRGNQV